MGIILLEIVEGKIEDTLDLQIEIILVGLQLVIIHGL